MPQHGQAFPVTAPVKGLNTRDPSIGPLEARELENWIPDVSACKIRPGFLPHQTIPGVSSVGALASFSHGASQTLVAAAGGSIWDVTGTPSVIGAGPYGSDAWIMEQYNGRLIGVNGLDIPWSYDGSMLGATGFTGTGLTLSNLTSVAQARDRLWFTEKNSADVWYGGAGAITGTLTKFQLSQIAPSGFCVDIAAWSRDTGAGMDDFTVFTTSTGWVVVYQGDVSSTFTMVGKYRVPEPTGYGCSVHVGGDLVLMTSSGPVPLTAAMTGIAQHPELLENWGKISPSWAEDFVLYKDVIGWNAHFFNGLVYFNIPVNTSIRKQYVFNTRNGGWCSFSGVNGYSFAEMGTSLYFSSVADGVIYRFAAGSDNGTPVTATARQGFLLALDSDQSKKFTAIWPGITADQPITAQFQIDTDFIADEIRAAPVVLKGAGGGGALWGAEWGSAWGTRPNVRQKWYGVKGFGSYAGPVVRVQSTAPDVKWRSLDIIAVQGGLL